MNEKDIYLYLLYFVFILTPFIAFTLFYITAPYGRHANTMWSPTINAKLGWVIMEISALVSFDVSFLLGTLDWMGLIFFLMWNTHYVYRTFIYPSRLPKSAKQMPVVIMLMGFLFNLVNGYLNGRYISGFSGGYSLNWVWSLPFIVGFIIFSFGLMVNIRSDNILLNLRKPGEKDYKIPKGFLYEYISCPNYFGEVVEWFGWAIATWSLPGLAFALFTAANLIPRAYSHHIWYKSVFSNYPSQRRAVLPFVL